MKTKNLLEKLDRFEDLLANYAYGELKSKDAVGLKQKFTAFKTDLNNKIFDEPIKDFDANHVQNTDQVTLLPKKVFNNAKQTIELLQSLKKTEFTQNQEEVLQKMEINTLILMELSMRILTNQNNATL